MQFLVWFKILHFACLITDNGRNWVGLCREETLRKQMEKTVEEMAMKKDRQIEHLKSQMVATVNHFQQKINDRVTEGMRDRETELRAKYVAPTPIVSVF